MHCSKQCRRGPPLRPSHWHRVAAGPLRPSLLLPRASSSRRRHRRRPTSARSRLLIHLGSGGGPCSLLRAFARCVMRTALCPRARGTRGECSVSLPVECAPLHGSAVSSSAGSMSPSADGPVSCPDSPPRCLSSRGSAFSPLPAPPEARGGFQPALGRGRWAMVAGEVAERPGDSRTPSAPGEHSRTRRMPPARWGVCAEEESKTTSAMIARWVTCCGEHSYSAKEYLRVEQP